MGNANLRYVIDGSTAAVRRSDAGRLILRGELTRESVTRLASQLEATGARPQVLDAAAVQFADMPALATLARWARRAGLSALRVDNPPAPLAALIARCRLDSLLVVSGRVAA